MHLLVVSPCSCEFYLISLYIYSNNSTCNRCKMSTSDLPNMYSQSLRTTGPRAEGIRIRQIMNAHVTTDV